MQGKVQDKAHEKVQGKAQGRVKAVYIASPVNVQSKLSQQNGRFQKTGYDEGKPKILL